MFESIENFISKNTYGPLSAKVVDVLNHRFIQITPYNYFILSTLKNIYLLLPPTVAANYKCNNQQSAMKFENGKKNTIVCIDYKFSDFINIFNKYGFITIPLNNIKIADSVSIEEIINLCIRQGLCRI